MSKQAIYNYDILGRLKEVTFSTGGKVSYNYDEMGNRTSVVEVAAAGCCFNWLGEWSNATDYIIGDAVSFNGSSYIAVADNTNSQPPSADWDLLAAKGDQGVQGATGNTGATGPTGNTGAQGAKGLNWRGTWSSATAYVIDDAVTLNGTSYIAVANNTNNSPPSANWNTLAAKGDQGPPGPSGSGGNSGAVRTTRLTRSSTTTPADDGQIQVSVAANSTYAFVGKFMAFGQTGNTGFDWQFVGPSGSTISVSSYDTQGNYSGPNAGGVVSTFAITASVRWLFVTGFITTGSTAGQLKLQWAQHTLSANYTALEAGSSLIIGKV